MNIQTSQLDSGFSASAVKIRAANRFLVKFEPIGRFFYLFLKGGF